MRSSKNRSRSKNNRNRSVGNIVNRVFDSSGPEGKVRGTPQQIIEKYNQLARDAQLSNDRVAAENFQQHAEHYLRLLGQAQKEQEAQREQQEREQQERRERQEAERAERQRKREEQQSNAAAGEGDQPDLVFVEAKEDSGLVETPEDQAPAKKPRAPRKPRKTKAQRDAETSENSEGGESPAVEADAPVEKKPTRRKPKAKAADADDASAADGESANDGAEAVAE
ncbi:DUF4167 domain-containing protein [Celeribacter litoreus]|uniref:DUF4167 domain-containing protein n=1 Tax=Celeribacter litoreus TaxID=2876714 RepID=UPI001CCF26D0|nr:DUF4167 domain-containing protein [Celeribacter litoreus]MCA0043697.1 DUF4167 domain-containing protein [Celeribacter litoreus]